MDSSPDFTGLHVKRRLSLEESGEQPFLYKQYLDKRLNPRWTTSFFMEQLMAYIYYLENNAEKLQGSLARCLKVAEDWLYEARGVELQDIYGDDGWVQDAHRLTMKWCEMLEYLENNNGK